MTAHFVKRFPYVNPHGRGQWLVSQDAPNRPPRSPAPISSRRSTCARVHRGSRARPSDGFCWSTRKSGSTPTPGRTCRASATSGVAERIVRPPPRLADEVLEGRLINDRGSPRTRSRTAGMRLVRKAGLDPKVHPRLPRHTAARWMRLRGVPVEEVAQQLGHRTLGVTAIYTKYDPAYLKKACAALDEPRASREGTSEAKLLEVMVLPARIELATSPLPRECSTTELRQQTFDMFASLRLLASRTRRRTGGLLLAAPHGQRKRPSGTPGRTPCK